MSGKRSIRVDGREAPLSGKDQGSFFDLGGSVRVPVGSSTGIVHIRAHGFSYSYDLVVDGRSVETGQAVPESASQEGRSMPAWGWIAVALCVTLPIATLGGAIPGALGAGAAAACYAVARDPTKPAATRMGLCAAIVAGCWAIAITLIVMVL